MTLMSRLVARILKLPPAETYEVDVQKNIPIPMPDGVILLADHYAPRRLSRRPTLPMMAPYRSTRHNEFFNRLYAERGFQVLAVSSRGAEGSGGQLDPFRQERADAQAVVTIKALYEPLLQITDSLSDTMTLAGSEAYSAALMFYSAVKNAMRSKVQKAETIYNDLQARFPGRPKKEAATG